MSMGWITTEESKVRRSQRQKVPSLAYVQLGPQNGGFLINVSEGGTNFQGIEPLEPEQVLRVKFRLPGTATSVEAATQVAWLNDTRKGGGLRFVELSDSTRNAIKEWVSRQTVVSGPQEDTQVTAAAASTASVAAPPSNGAGAPAATHVPINTKISQALSEAATAAREAPQPVPEEPVTLGTDSLAEAVSTDQALPEAAAPPSANREAEPAQTSLLNREEAVPPSQSAVAAPVLVDVAKLITGSVEGLPRTGQAPVPLPDPPALPPNRGGWPLMDAPYQEPAQPYVHPRLSVPSDLRPAGESQAMRMRKDQALAQGYPGFAPSAQGFEEPAASAVEPQSGFLGSVSPRTLWMAGAAIALALLLFLFRGYLPGSGSGDAEAVTRNPLGLKLQRSGSDWQVSWNRDAAVVSNAVGGHLLITDGTAHKDLALDPNELRSGSVVYTPVSPDAVLQLTIVTPSSSQPISETVRIVGSVPQMDAKEQAASLLSALFRSSPTPRSPRSSTDNSRAASSVASSSPDPARNAAPLNMAHPRLPSLAQTGASAAATGQSGGNAALDQNSPLTGTTDRLEASSRLPVIGVGRSQPSMPAAPPPPGVFEPPKLISGREPIYPALAAAMEFSGPVELHFVIRADGSVGNVVATKGNPVFIPPAIEAVKAWRYQPATRGGIPIESEANTVIHFQRR